MDLTLKENSSSMKLCLLEVLSEEEYLSSVWPYLKDLVGILPTTAMLSLITTVKDKDVHSLLVHAPPTMENSLNIAQEASTEVALPTVEEVVSAKVILSLKVANTTILSLIMIVRMRTVLIMPLSLNCKISEEM